MQYNQFFDDFQYRSTLVSRLFLDALTKKKDLKTRRPIRLRASSLPTCSLLLLEKMLLNEYDKDEAMMDYYCSVGTTIHSHTQKWLGDCGKLYGDWRCPNKQCSAFVQHSIDYKCPKCQNLMDYCEIELEYDIFSGHVDSIFLQPNGRYIVVDYKSTSSRSVSERKFIPNAKHLIQIAAYAAVLTKVYNLDIESVSILYIARDNPQQIAEFNLDYDEDLHAHTMQFLRNQIKGFKAAERAKETGNLRLAQKYKLCQSYDHYKEEVEKFIGFDGCPLARTCFSEQACTRHFTSLDLF